MNEKRQIVLLSAMVLSMVINFFSEAYLKDDGKKDRFRRFLFPRKDDYNEMGWTLKIIAMGTVICGFLISVVIK